MSQILGRTRYKTEKVLTTTMNLGTFTSAIFDGGGNFLRWGNPTPMVTTVPAPIYKRGQFTKDSIFRGKLRERIGSPFLSLRYDLGYDPSNVVGFGTRFERSGGSGSKIIAKYEGGFMPPPNVYFGTGFEFTDLTPLLISTNPVIPSIAGLGSKAWNLTRPNLEQMSSFQDVFESNEIPGQFTGTRDFVHHAREISQDWKNKYLADMGTHVRGTDRITAAISREWLNANFGWLPFLRSIYDLSQIIGNFRNLVVKFTKLNGRPFRIRKNLVNGDPSEVELSSTSYAPNSISYALPVFPQSFPTKYFAATPHYSLTEVTRLRQWGVGKWTYYRPEFDAAQPGFYSAFNKMKQALTLTGLRITPTALYNVIPWTWLLDWVTNVGDYIDELTGIWEDQIVNHYCFVMQSKEVQRRFVVFLPFHDSPLNLTFTRLRSSKERGKGSSPFGFDLDVSNLSMRQLSILAAIKTSRRR